MGCSYKSIRVPAGVHEKSDKLSTVVDAVDCGGADPFRIIDRLEESIVEDESVSKSCSVHIRSNHVVLTVQAECLGEGGSREVESCELPLGEQKTVVLTGTINVKTRDRPTVVDASRLGPACGCRDGDHQKHSAITVENVGVIDVRGIREIARSLVKIIKAEKLVEGGTWEIYGRESAVDVQEAVSGSSHIDIEPVGKAPVVDSDHLCLRGIGKILQSEIVGEGEDESLVDVSSMITGDHFKIVDADQLGERVAWENDCPEAKAAFLFLFLFPG